MFVEASLLAWNSSNLICVEIHIHVGSVNDRQQLEIDERLPPAMLGEILNG